MKQLGILCPIFSLPGDYGIGDFGPAAYRFLDILHHTDFEIWQVLPLNPIGFGHSPYQPLSSFAGETVYIDLGALKKDGLLKSVPKAFSEQPQRVDYEAAADFKKPYFEEAFRTFQSLPKKPDAYHGFLQEEWVIPYGVFSALRKKNDGRKWQEWPEEEKTLFLDGASPEAVLKSLSDELQKEAELEIFLQYEFRIQWLRITEFAHKKNIRIMGDIPMYVGGDSLDVYTDRGEFLLNPEGYPLSVAGVPPDYFSATGQRWGNPIYDWEKMEANHFAFWKKRLKGTAQLYDMIRIDHFLAFHAFWKIPAECETAVGGEWISGPGEKFFDEVLPEIKGTQIIAEDLGLIRPEVYELRDKYGFPGMNVLLFTMGDEGFRRRENMITYTGTHDNRTVLEHYEKCEAWERERFDAGLTKANIDRNSGSKAWQTITYALQFGTDYVILNIGDVLEQGEEGRINEPGTVNEKNWTYALRDLDAVKKQCRKIQDLRKKIRRTHGKNQTI